ncbi:AzlC family ABC transporter permease [Shimia aestuarii]|uniref:Predicted branched-chain amino acid permease (Azaleucine resistance) n=1 Tax=Shimia aestuarii TaxID=254406 RepID=A0A1I4I1C7_9RHOB|nr:AzlC family ABC transporter permease [Shimia aestuarii]SFL47536.1 Predicted branched-chain amino acid permease (azaleucine resistance) [Shimia aestuarii]
MTSYFDRSYYLKGIRDGLPFIFVVAPFGLLFGVVATEAGLSIFETMSFTVLVIAGAAQFTALQLMAENAPTVIVIISALAVNLRMAMYSASLTPHIGGLPFWHRVIAAYFLVDQNYALSSVKYEQEPDMTLPQKFSYMMGAITPVAPNWYLATFVGALIGKTIPPGLALDFAVPICFLAMIGPMLRTGAHVAAALVAVTLSLVFAFLPYNLGLMVAGIAGMITGAQVELWTERRRAS